MEVDKVNTTRLFTGQGGRGGEGIERNGGRNCQSQEMGESHPYTSKGVKSLSFKIKEIDSPGCSP